MTKRISTSGGQGNEKSWESRRMWAAIFIILMAVLQGVVQLGYVPENIILAFSPLISIVAGMLGIESWRKPK